MYDLTDKDINVQKCSCVLNCFCECPGVFVTNEEMNGEKYVDLPFIHFHHYENISSWSFHKQLLPEHSKTCTSCMNSAF